MTVESLKSELQQVLDNDLILRKEFNELKRSLSDYRNQLIMRDEDCKRLQVTIDVLNTKLVVMERDNNNYKAELTSFKELRSTIKDQLQAKQEEIEGRLAEIQSLKNEINTLAAGYEKRIEEINNEAIKELSNVMEDFNTQISEMKAVAAYKEQAIKEEYENRINDLSNSIANKEQNFEINFQEQISELTNKYENELKSQKERYDSKIITLSDGSREEIDSLIVANQQTMSELQNKFIQEKELIETNYVSEISHLKNAIEEQRQTLTNNFNQQLELLKSDYTSREEKMVLNYETQISSLSNQLSHSASDLNENFQAQINALSSAHQNLIQETNAAHENKIASIVCEYEEKLSVTLIHSNAQNSKLNEELNKSQSQNETSIHQIQELTASIVIKSDEIIDLSNQIVQLENELNIQTSKFNQLGTEFEEFKSKASMSNTEQVTELNGKLEALNESHNLIVDELKTQIENQNLEITNLGLILEATTNAVTSNESQIESKTIELNLAQQKLYELEAELIKNQLEFETEKAALNEKGKKELELQNLEFEKLLIENSNLITEIETVQLTLETQESEINLLRSELEEIRTISLGKAADFKEILANKNFEITNLEANKAALAEELVHAKMEILNLENQIQHNVQNGDMILDLTNQINNLLTEKETLHSDLAQINDSVKGLNDYIQSLNEKVSSYEKEIETLKGSATSEEQDAFIDRLFKQIDGLSDERLALLEEKEQMANQLLKMNDVISTISQQVDTDKINVTDLNNHRKNVILATNSNDLNERSQMKEQINDLVREIDKCIALLSA